VVSVELRMILNSLKRGWQSILVIVCLMAGPAALINLFVLSPMYQASTMVMVVPKDAFYKNSLMQYNDILTAHYQWTQMYQEIAQSRSVAEKVIQLEKLEETPEELKDRVFIYRLSNTELIQIVVEEKDPYKAQRIANTLTQVFMEKVAQIMKIDSLVLVEDAVLPEKPQDQKIGYKILVAGMIGLLIAISRILVLLCLDSTIKTSEEISCFLKLPVLGVIPKTQGEVLGSFLMGEKQ